jgi:hypothetical protein
MHHPSTATHVEEMSHPMEPLSAKFPIRAALQILRSRFGGHSGMAGWLERGYPLESAIAGVSSRSA